jgi:N6-adenosine-specific RNA methylase IME4
METMNQKKYKILYADPPWRYTDKCHSGKRGADYKYKTMSIEDIANLPIKEITDDDCILFLWVTMPFIFEAKKIIEAWGFQYKTIGFGWVKKNKISDSLFFGMGNYTRSNLEICLLAVKGKPKRVSKSVHSVIVSRIEHHSKKPDEARDRIVKLCGDLPRIELFARTKTPGWDAWGLEIQSDIQLERK